MRLSLLVHRLINTSKLEFWGFLVGAQLLSDSLRLIR